MCVTRKQNRGIGWKVRATEEGCKAYKQGAIASYIPILPHTHALNPHRKIKDCHCGTFYSHGLTLKVILLHKVKSDKPYSAV